MQPLNALCLLVLLGAALRLRWKEAGQKMIATGVTLILALAILPIGPLMTAFLEQQYPTPTELPKKIDGIIVLGGAFESYLSKENGQIVANDQIDRIFCFIDLAKKHPEAKLVFSGGAGDILNPQAMEGDDARAFFKLINFKSPILYEEKSRNTYENILFTKELVKPRSGQNWVVTTSAYHMPRTMAVFAKQEWPAIPYACDPKTDGTYNVFKRLPNATGNFHLLNLATKEILGAIVYWITGKSAFIFGPQPIPSNS